MAESKFFSDARAQVTPTRLVLDGVFYSTGGLRSAQVVETTPDRRLGYALLTAGISLLLVALVPLVLFLALFSERTNLLANLFPIIFIALTAGLGLWLLNLGRKNLKSHRTNYLLALVGTGGQTETIRSRDRVYLQNIATAINEALQSRR